ncbi:hypothetical protein SDC9_140415 [bioreactor metagenome]|uniref:Uncharacterized protein n=1 Tax=bioreactor metagenome TaxID=1076179 RepID=A0A645DVF6_9ZZZZ
MRAGGEGGILLTSGEPAVQRQDVDRGVGEDRAGQPGHHLADLPRTGQEHQGVPLRVLGQGQPGGPDDVVEERVRHAAGVQPGDAGRGRGPSDGQPVEIGLGGDDRDRPTHCSGSGSGSAGAGGSARGPVRASRVGRACRTGRLGDTR